VAAFTFLTPVLGMAAGVLLLDEPMSGALLIGLAGVAVGLWLVNRR
jgi:drug/metabolite transporter (DMT)-like permease